jgi:RNA polymerase sigma-70 factor (ECF subfamily)
LLKAWHHLDSFKDGSNLKAWLFTILRNTFISEYRKRSRELQDVGGLYTSNLVVEPDQPGHVDLKDFERALANLPRDQREALILVGAEGFSYEEAAQISGCAVGTVKSRVNRARRRLTELLSLDNATDSGVEKKTKGSDKASSRELVERA